MEIHVNGWPTIERQLQRMDRRQGEIAQLLEMTPAAVSQVKKGCFLLNPKQLEKIAIFLQFDEDMRSEFYSELFNARLICRDPAAAQPPRDSGQYRVCLNTRGALRRKQRCEIPMADISLLAGYDPALEPLAGYLLRNSPERKSDALPGIDVCALRVGADDSDTGLSADSLIIVEGGRYPEPGTLNLVALRDGRYLLREFHPEGELVRLAAVLRDSGEDFVWRREGVPGPVIWMHPVLEVTVRSPR